MNTDVNGQLEEG